jgi:ATP-dependent Clp protease ATP-binding subunit ClpC
MVGFQTSESATDKKVNEKVMSEVRKNFNPEFLNRLDETIIFESLTDEDLEKIVDLLILQVNENLARRGLSVNLNPDVRRWIVDTTCQDRSYGARPLRRAIQKYIEDPLSEALIKNSLPAGSSLEVLLKDNTLCYTTAGQDHREAIPLYH